MYTICPSENLCSGELEGGGGVGARGKQRVTAAQSDAPHASVEFLRALGGQSGVSVWQHTLVG